MAERHEINGDWKQYGISVFQEEVSKPHAADKKLTEVSYVWVAYLPNGDRYGVVDQVGRGIEVDAKFKPKAPAKV